MPLFVFFCEKCHQQSEILVRGSETPTCAKCGSSELTKQMSTFAPIGASSAPASGSGCGCCPSRMNGSCPGQ